MKNVVVQITIQIDGNLEQKYRSNTETNRSNNQTSRSKISDLTIRRKTKTKSRSDQQA